MAVCLYVYLNDRSSNSKPPNIFFKNVNYLHKTCILDENMNARNYFKMLENRQKTALRIFIIFESKISLFTVKSCTGIKKGVLRSKVQFLRKKVQ